MLRRLYPLLLHRAVTSFGSPEVLRFLGHRTRQDSRVPGWFHGEATTDLRERQEGVRIKHTVNGNSVKLYDKAYTAQGSILRPEVTLNNPADLRVYRPKEGDPKGPKAWRPLRRGIADVYRRGQVSQQVINRYLEALAQVDDTTRLEELLPPLARPVTWKKKRVRALHPLDGPDTTLLEAVGRGEFFLNGFRNRDLQAIFFSRAANSVQEKRRRSAWVSRQIRLLRAHGLVRKVPHENRYQVTASGRLVITAVLAARKATVSRLASLRE